MAKKKTKKENKIEIKNVQEHEEEQKISDYYINRRLEKNQMERKVRKTQMWLGNFRILLRLFIILMLIFIGYKLLRVNQWYLEKDIFKTADNKSLEIVNNKIVSSTKILAALRKTQIPHTPIYRLETDEIRNNILQLDPVDKVFVRRFWFPARLQIIIEEKTPILTISPEVNVEPIAFFTKDGKLIGRDYMPLNTSFKTTKILSYGTRGDDYRNWNYSKIKQIEKLAKTIKANSNEEIEYIDFRNPEDIYVKVKTVNIRLGKIDDTVMERVQRIPSLLPQIKMLDKPIKYIDLRWNDTNYIKLN